MYYERTVKDNIVTLKKGFPIISVTGPRQSGKTTFLRNEFPEYKYFNLEDPSLLSLIKGDPKGFLQDNPKDIIIDEIQRFPELFSYLQVHVDDTQVMGGILISGSQNFLIADKISQSLAGRAAYKTIYPFSIQELIENNILDNNLNINILRGFYPSLYSRDITFSDYYPQYLSTYVQRDLQTLKSITDLSLFQKFLVLLAARVGQVLNLSSLAKDVGIAPNTVESWISILEASYIVYRLKPYYKNIGKRLIKSPKIYFYDTGLLCSLLRINNEEELINHYLYGNIFENFIVSEFKKIIENGRDLLQIYFARDNHGNEIDLIIDNGSCLKCVEIKASKTFSTHFLKGLESYGRSLGEENIKKFVIYNGKENIENMDTTILTWNSYNLVLDKHKSI